MSKPVDFTAEAPQNKDAPWQAPISPRGEDPWNQSKEARQHPEEFSTAHGTVDFDNSSDDANSSLQQHSQSSKKKDPHNTKDAQPHDNTEGFGHTVSQPHVVDSTIKRDPDNIGA
ncbi:uncharacterized protein BYT42DRAFT_616834 [Radiomyces spectabilis]|uniref:uncharacterized protein n=1 Tax=Radiomyces spectabilis TaxID=64574 RepID=UPI0022206A84|nr:uncharacterized protein BYT42DRAFT_616834 [Radiomyces spectabilis]KAI8371774.1 hypothetical protein BYT42DRAFT_616834 [Radiomyces spectabilis]